MSKRKRSAKQKAASLRNLRKARRKRAGAAAPKRRRHRARAAAAPKRRRRRARAAAPRKHRRRIRRRARAAAAPKRRRRRGRRSARDFMTAGPSGYQYSPGGTVRLNSKGEPIVKKRRRNKKKPTTSRRRGRRRSRKHAAPRKRYFRKASGTTRRGRRRRRVVRSRSRRHYVKGYTVKRGRRAGKHVKGHYSYEAAAFENPLSTGEVVVVGLVGVLGALVAQGADRFAATHALTGTIAADGSGLTDAPGKGQDYNANSVNAPMGLLRWGIAAGLSIVPIVGAHYIRSPMARTSLQAFGFGALIRTGLKAGSDLAGWAMRKQALGQRLFAPEIMAHAADKSFMAQVKTNPDMQLPPAPVLGGTDTQMLAANPNGKQGCADCPKGQPQNQQFSPPPPPPGVGSPPAQQHQAPPQQPASNGVSGYRLYAPKPAE